MVDLPRRIALMGIDNGTCQIKSERSRKSPVGSDRFERYRWVLCCTRESGIECGKACCPIECISIGGAVELEIFGPRYRSPDF